MSLSSRVLLWWHSLAGHARPGAQRWHPRTGQWWVALSGGDGFQCRPVTRVDPADPWTQVAVADVDGDGRDALVGWSPKTGTCWVARFDGEQFICQPWGHLSGPVTDLCVADFDGDGRVDVAWRNPETGELFVGLGRGATLQVQPRDKVPKSEKLTPLSVYKAWR